VGRPALEMAFAAVCMLLCSCQRSSVDPANVTPAGPVSCALVQGQERTVRTLFCVEFTGLSVARAEGQQTSCGDEVTDAGGAAWTFAHEACSRDGAIGGCRYVSIGTTQWFYQRGIYLRPEADGGDGGAAGPESEIPSCGAGVVVGPSTSVQGDD
jgi:hypothetical protein